MRPVTSSSLTVNQASHRLVCDALRGVLRQVAQAGPDAAEEPSEPVSAPGSDPPLIDSPAAAAEALRDYFLANAEAGDNAANDELVAEMVRRIRTRHASADGGR